MVSRPGDGAHRRERGSVATDGGSPDQAAHNIRQHGASEGELTKGGPQRPKAARHTGTRCQKSFSQRPGSSFSERVPSLKLPPPLGRVALSVVIVTSVRLPSASGST